MKLKTTLVASALLSATAFSVQAAQELTPQKAAELKPFEQIAISGRFNMLSEAADAVSRRADQLGAAYFYILDTNASNDGGNWRVVANVYKKDAATVDKSQSYRYFQGVKELPKAEAVALQPFDTVTVSGFFNSQPEVNDAVARAAKKKEAAAFYIVRQIDTNNGGNQTITAYVFKADAPKRQVQSPDAIPADSDAGRAALAAGGAAAANVEIPGVASSSTLSSNVGQFWQTQSSSGHRYTVTLPNGTKIEELNNATAAQMVPFDSITFTGRFNSMTDMSTEAAKRAAAKGAKYYHITRQWQNQSGGNLTVSADLFK
ncbi:MULTISPECIES: DUF1471 family protein YdgH [Edwardsiella]|uniref:Antigenic protein Et 32 n=2 Tax=Edwardsiella anguillarum TaxID=1821960 RepID=A0A076LUS1_9GAMM|nr:MULTISPECIES: DUF1471 family protein YdgH [Edwardsiella]AKM47865.1 hypothetical protein QY76_11400 [Edwardsiella sp. EA181011]GAJ68883.1 protein YdgH [Edwardsiella piscicida]AIJ10208.1 antigenic protein Et 32 [Edwardsiella anguillarum ET080813]AKR77773.1 DUF1471 family protein YdgH [Edwardsiella sp. LADL05-105]KAB0592121.1 DUF1471 domain-containing protein [Edwardsiella anguillarum]